MRDKRTVNWILVEESAQGCAIKVETATEEALPLPWLDDAAHRFARREFDDPTVALPAKEGDA